LSYSATDTSTSGSEPSLGNHLSTNEAQGWLFKILKYVPASGKIDHVGVFMLGLTIFTLFGPPVVALFTVYMDLHPWIFVLIDLVPSDILNMQVTKWVTSIVLYFSALLMISEFIRLIPMVLIALFLPGVENVASIRDLIQYQMQYKSFNNSMTLYDLLVRLKVINIHATGYVLNASFLFTVYGAVFTCVGLFGVMRWRAALPPFLYAIIVFATFTCMGLIHVTFGTGMNVHEVSNEALISWRAQFRGHKYLRRKFAPLKSIRFYIGFEGSIFYLMEKSLRTEYYVMLLDNTINLLMTFPAAV